jgi:lipid-A-disaccharide synthase
MAMSPAPIRIFIVAGEASGDALGAALMAALPRILPGREFAFRGVGGAQMRAEGLHAIFPVTDLAVMGFLEIVPRLPLLMWRLRQTARDIAQWRPDIIVTIDAPGFNKRLAKKIGRGKIPLIHYVAPSVWAWRPGRAKTMARLFDHVLCLLPFEPPYFHATGMRADFVGHPIVNSDWDKGDAAIFRARHNLTGEQNLLCLLPGSRKQEIRRHLPLFLDVYRRLRQKDANLLAVLPTLPELRGVIAPILAKTDLPVIISDDLAEKKHCFAAATVALACSGTVSLELNRAGVATVIAYRTSRFSAWLVRRLVKTRYFTLANILMQQQIIPEFFQENSNPKLLTDAVDELLRNPSARQQQIAQARLAIAMLQPPGDDPALAAARIVAGYL